MRAGTKGAVRRLGVCGSNLVAANVVQLAAGLGAERILRIETQKILVDSLRLLQVAQVALVDFPFGQQGAEAVAAAGVLVPQKFILADSVMESLVLLKDAPLFGKQIGNGGDRRIGPRRGSRRVRSQAFHVQHFGFKRCKHVARTAWTEFNARASFAKSCCVSVGTE
jgi:hypothetical protein